MLSAIKNHCHRVWKGEEPFWRIGCVWVGLIISLYLVDKNELWNIYILFFYARGFISSYDGFIMLLMWIGCFILYVSLIFYTIFVIYTFIRKKIVLKSTPSVSMNANFQNSDSAPQKSFTKYIPDILLILWALWTAWGYGMWFVGTVTLLATAYIVLGVFTTWYAILCSKIYFIYKLTVLILFPIIPLLLISLSYSNLFIAKRVWYLEEKKIQSFIETITP